MQTNYELNVTRVSPVSNSLRVRQLETMFDVPRTINNQVCWSGKIELPETWNIGLIVGPSGAGKTTLAREMFGEFIEINLMPRAS